MISSRFTCFDVTDRLRTIKAISSAIRPIGSASQATPAKPVKVAFRCSISVAGCAGQQSYRFEKFEENLNRG